MGTFVPAYAHPPVDCAPIACPLIEPYLIYNPSLPGNASYLAVFSFLLLAQLAMGIRYRTWSYMAAMVSGLALEAIGYAGRIQLHHNSFQSIAFREHLICLIIGPLFFSAAISICFGHVMMIYGERVPPFRPRTYIAVFVAWNGLTLIMQTAGAIAMSITNDTYSGLTQKGVGVVIAGLAIQVALLGVFIGSCMDFARRVHQYPERLNWGLVQLRGSFMWKGLLGGLITATLAIFVRSIFRLSALGNGVHSDLANDEVAFMFLEGAMVVVATVCLTIFHPGLCFDGQWDRPALRLPKSHYSLSSRLSPRCAV